VGQTNISIRVDEDVKKEAETLFAKLGLTLSSATNVFYRQAVRTQGIPFPLTLVGQQGQTDETDAEIEIKSYRQDKRMWRVKPER